MPAKKPPQEPLLPIEPPDDDEQIDLDLYDFLGSLGPGIASIDVFRMNRDGSRPHVDRITMDAIREDVYSYLRSLGAGKYLLQFMDANRRYKKSKVIEVADKGTPAPAAPVHNGSNDTLGFLREQLAQQQTLLLALIGNMGQNRGPDLSFLAGVLKPPDMTPVTALMTALITRKPDAPAVDGLQMAKTIVELSRDIGGGGSDDAPPDNMWSAVASVGKSLFTGFTGNGYNPALTPAPTVTVVPAEPPQAQPQLPAPPVYTPAAPENEPVNKANFVHWLGIGLRQLKAKALLNKDVELMAEYVIENTEESHWAAVAGAVQQGAKFADLLQFDPEIAQNPQLRTWFQGFYNALYAEVFNADDSPGTGGDSPDAGGHAGTGPAGPVAGGSPDTGPDAG